MCGIEKSHAHCFSLALGSNIIFNQKKSERFLDMRVCTWISAFGKLWKKDSEFVNSLSLILTYSLILSNLNKIKGKFATGRRADYPIGRTALNRDVQAIIQEFVCSCFSWKYRRCSFFHSPLCMHCKHAYAWVRAPCWAESHTNVPQWGENKHYSLFGITLVTALLVACLNQFVAASCAGVLAHKWLFQ